MKRSKLVCTTAVLFMFYSICAMADLTCEAMFYQPIESLISFPSTRNIFGGNKKDFYKVTLLSNEVVISPPHADPEAPEFVTNKERELYLRNLRIDKERFTGRFRAQNPDGVYVGPDNRMIAITGEKPMILQETNFYTIKGQNGWAKRSSFHTQEGSAHFFLVTEYPFTLSRPEVPFNKIFLAMGSQLLEIGIVQNKVTKRRFWSDKIETPDPSKTIGMTVNSDFRGVSITSINGVTTEFDIAPTRSSRERDLFIRGFSRDNHNFDHTGTYGEDGVHLNNSNEVIGGPR